VAAQTPGRSMARDRAAACVGVNGGSSDRHYGAALDLVSRPAGTPSCSSIGPRPLPVARSPPAVAYFGTGARPELLPRGCRRALGWAFLVWIGTIRHAAGGGASEAVTCARRGSRVVILRRAARDRVIHRPGSTMNALEGDSLPPCRRSGRKRRHTNSRSERCAEGRNPPTE